MDDLEDQTFLLCATAGRLDEAVSFTEEAVRLGFEHVESMENDPDLEPVRNHPRFRKLIDGILSG